MNKYDCKNCASTGIVECVECGGTGKALEVNILFEEEPSSAEICFMCEGTGSKVCQECNGNGFINEDSKKLETAIK